MTAAPLHHTAAITTRAKRARNWPTPSLLRALLLLGCAAAIGVALGFGDPAPSLRADPELAVLLRGMALIKAGIVMAALAAIAWRLGHPIGRATALAYLAGAWLTAAATALIWQLSAITLAAALFHVGALALLVVAYTDRKSAPSPAFAAGLALERPDQLGRDPAAVVAAGLRVDPRAADRAVELLRVEGDAVGNRLGTEERMRVAPRHRGQAALAIDQRPQAGLALPLAQR
jgi:hypothetical protein